MQPKACINMASITIRHIPDDVHRELRLRAAQHGHGIQAEILCILEQAIRPQGRLHLGTLMTAIAQDAGGLTDAEVACVDQLRDKPAA